MKMMLLSGMAAGLFVILAFALGAVIGTRFYCPFSRRMGGSGSSLTGASDAAVNLRGKAIPL